MFTCQALRCRLSASSLPRRRVARAGTAAAHRPVRRRRACRLPEISNRCRGCRKPRPAHKPSCPARSDRHRSQCARLRHEVEGGHLRPRRPAAPRARAYRSVERRPAMSRSDSRPSHRSCRSTSDRATAGATSAAGSVLRSGRSSLTGRSRCRPTKNGSEPTTTAAARAGSRGGTLPCTSTSASM